MFDEQPADPAAALALVEAEQARTAAALEPDPRVVYGTWGAGWLAGFLALWCWASDAAPFRLPGAVAGIAFAVCIAGSMALTVGHITRRGAGIRGASSRVGAMYGWTWSLGFLCVVAIMSSLYRSGIDDDLGALLWCVLSALVVGLLYLAGGALWQDRVQYGLGAWILVAAAAGALAGFPSVYLVMGVGGGGGFLAAAAFFASRGGRW